jgi:exoribonuclease-2
LKIRFGQNGEIIPEKTNWDTPARRMIGEMMILANHLAAETLAQAGLACPFRWQEKPRELPPSLSYEPETKDEALIQDLAQRRRLGRGGISVSPAPHHGLGLTSYAQFTSPIRRYGDLLVARQIRSLKDPKITPYSLAEMTELAFAADELHREIKKAQNERARYFLTLWLSDRLGAEYPGIIFERQDARTRICLTDFMLEIDLHKLPFEAKIGRWARFRLAQANAKKQTLRFDYVGLM